MSSPTTPAPLDLAQFEGFTPGPWAASFDDDFVMSDEGAICEVMPQDMSDDTGEVSEDESRAREVNNLELLAAAPALLAECIRQRAEIERLRQEVQFTIDYINDFKQSESVDDLETALEHARAALSGRERSEPMGEPHQEGA